MCNVTHSTEVSVVGVFASSLLPLVENSEDHPMDDNNNTATVKEHSSSHFNNSNNSITISNTNTYSVTQHTNLINNTNTANCESSQLSPPIVLARRLSTASTHSFCCQHANQLNALLKKENENHASNAASPWNNSINYSSDSQRDQKLKIANQHNLFACMNPHCPLPHAHENPLVSLVSPLEMKLSEPHAFSSTHDLNQHPFVSSPLAVAVHSSNSFQNPATLSNALSANLKPSPPRTSTSTPLINPLAPPQVRALLSAANASPPLHHSSNVASPESSINGRMSCIHPSPASINHVAFPANPSPVDVSLSPPQSVPPLHKNSSASNSNIQDSSHVDFISPSSLAPLDSNHLDHSYQQPNACTTFNNNHVSLPPPPGANRFTPRVTLASPQVASVAGSRNSFFLSPLMTGGTTTAPPGPGNYLCRCQVRGVRTARASRFSSANNTPLHQFTSSRNSSPFQAPISAEILMSTEETFDQNRTQNLVLDKKNNSRINKEISSVNSTQAEVAESKNSLYRDPGPSNLLSFAVASLKRDSIANNTSPVASCEPMSSQSLETPPSGEPPSICDVCGGLKATGSSLLLGVSKTVATKQPPSANSANAKSSMSNPPSADLLAVNIPANILSSPPIELHSSSLHPQQQLKSTNSEPIHKPPSKRRIDIDGTPHSPHRLSSCMSRLSASSNHSPPVPPSDNSSSIWSSSSNRCRSSCSSSYHERKRRGRQRQRSDLEARNNQGGHQKLKRRDPSLSPSSSYHSSSLASLERRRASVPSKKEKKKDSSVQQRRLSVSSRVSESSDMSVDIQTLAAGGASNHHAASSFTRRSDRHSSPRQAAPRNTVESESAPNSNRRRASLIMQSHLAHVTNDHFSLSSQSAELKNQEKKKNLFEDPPLFCKHHSNGDASCHHYQHNLEMSHAENYLYSDNVLVESPSSPLPLLPLPSSCTCQCCVSNNVLPSPQPTPKANQSESNNLLHAVNDAPATSSCLCSTKGAGCCSCVHMSPKVGVASPTIEGGLSIIIATANDLLRKEQTDNTNNKATTLASFQNEKDS
eukprot:GDKJ01063497.1.p1 GENE.GDKJ01063497.1~~GDKJ01063497.1.p1  ORF type:complete len:1096 (+),score=315.78 GDKJ01063497.1:158-3289(+)